MAIRMGYYRKRPIVSEAMLFEDADNVMRDIDVWMAAAPHMFLVSPERVSLHFDTLGGTMVAHPGDWIIRGIQGEFYSCKPDIFEATYEAVD
jgi:hypothetical protein